MSDSKNRSYPRFFCEKPILFSTYEKNNFHEAVMYNIGEDGMYLESSVLLDSGADIYIKLTELSSCKMNSKDFNGYRGEVKWINTIEENADTVYGAGILLKVKGHFYLGGSFEKMGYPCEICRKNISDEKIIPGNKDYELICSTCCSRIDGWQDRIAKGYIESFIEGNVL